MLVKNIDSVVRYKNVRNSPLRHRHTLATTNGVAGAPAPLCENRSVRRAREQTSIGLVCAAAVCGHSADRPLSTPLCPHGKNLGKRGTGGTTKEGV